MSQKNFIAAGELDNVRAWDLPTVGGNVLPSAEKEARDAGDHKDSGVVEVVGETVDEIPDELGYAPITAEELQAITDAAEKEGFDKGHGEGLQKGISEGRERGYQEGLVQAQADGAETLREQVGNLLTIAEQLQQPIADQQQQLEGLLLAMVSSLTKQLVKRELHTDSGDVLQVVRQAIEALPVGAESITLRLNPDDLALVEAYAEEQHLSWRFIGDNQLLPGGCRVESRDSLVDFSVEAQLQALLEQFGGRQLIDEDTAPEQVLSSIAENHVVKADVATSDEIKNDDIGSDEVAPADTELPSQESENLELQSSEPEISAPEISKNGITEAEISETKSLEVESPEAEIKVSAHDKQSVSETPVMPEAPAQSNHLPGVDESSKGETPTDE